MEKDAVQKKIEAVDALAKKLEKAVTIVSFDYPGLTVDKFTKLRNELRSANCEVNVYKNNISRRASEKVGFGQLVDSLVGAKAIAISYDDVVAPAKIIYDFSRENKEVKIQSGVIEKLVVGQKELIALAMIPSRETLLTQLAAGLLMPIREIAIGLNMLDETNFAQK